MSVIGIAYIGGMCFTMFNRGNKIDEYDDITFEQTGKFIPAWKFTLLAIAGVLKSMFWPVYWTGRALYMPAERLLLPPGDPL